MKGKAVYAGTFDPPTNGHVSIHSRAKHIFPDLIVAVGTNPSKRSLFTTDERVSLVSNTFRLERAGDVTSFSGLLVDFCRDQGITVIVRGLRAATDYELEMAVAQANAMMAPDIQTVFLPTEPGQSFVSSSVVKEMASLARDNTIDAVRRALGRFVAPNVAEALLAKRKAV